MDTEGVGMTQPILEARNVVKRFGVVTALDHSDFDLYPGEILAVIGDNGAGKSTLIKVLTGALSPDEGQVLVGGKEVRFSSPLEARQAGIETVYQTLALSPALSIADNMFMGRELRKPGFLGKALRMLDRKKMEEVAREKISDLGVQTIQDISQAVETLSGGQRQSVAVARVPSVFEVADRIHIHRLGKRLCVINPADYTMSDAVAFMTGARQPDEMQMAS
ncbi:MAG: ATP-binding cassette domain-containing protein [Acidihalobacter sp.]